MSNGSVTAGSALPVARWHGRDWRTEPLKDGKHPLSPAYLSLANFTSLSVTMELLVVARWLEPAQFGAELQSRLEENQAITSN